MPLYFSGLSPLLIKNSLRHLKKHLWQTWLCIVGIMLGVSIIVAVDLANSSAQKAFDLSLNTLSGYASHQLVAGPMGIDEKIYAQLKLELGLSQASPGISDHVSIKGHTLNLVGIDIFSAVNSAAAGISQRPFNVGQQELADFINRANTVVLSSRSAKLLQVTTGDTLRLNHRSSLQIVKVVGIFTSDNPAATEGLIFCDIASAQELLARPGKLDVINLKLNQEEFEALKKWLSQPQYRHLKLIDHKQKSNSLSKMSGAFHTNLTAMSFLAIMVGALLIYNCMTFSILQRRQTLGVLRNLGVTKMEIFALILWEALALGLVGTLAGLGLGIILGQGLLHLVLQTINDLYFNLHVREYFISPVSIFKGAAVGLLVTLLAAFIPAWEATHSQPLGVLQRSNIEYKVKGKLPWLFLTGLMFVACGLQISSYSHASVWLGFLALALLALGFILAVPLLVLWLIKSALIFNPFFNNMTRQILRGIGSGISRSGLAIAALTLAIAVTIGVGVMVDSFRATVANWLTQTLSGDVYVSLAGRSSARGNQGLPESLMEGIQNLPGITAINTSRMIKAQSQYGLIRLMAVTKTSKQEKDLNIKTSVAHFRKLFNSGQGILISEPMAYHHKIKLKDKIEIQT